ncbi:uncharacterized protein LY89DRAFT_674637 [Mollisia scopiformis]|uniref:C2H2-type domain-containing protein n=1 Tax=Mollisia scopiformis TaxID=149040 RepID=A0A194WTM2_MOLSC|nr:uncharacterized protein LY89DRAFT_674637 [Mollisia scopiformis]KUJ11306.1 hypothetical protein LY89DRAFT_674637 [Mollisia scopiformis]
MDIADSNISTRKNGCNAWDDEFQAQETERPGAEMNSKQPNFVWSQESSDNLVAAQANANTLPSLPNTRAPPCATTFDSSINHLLTRPLPEIEISDRNIILAELSSLQSRCATLQRLVAGASSPVKQCQCGHGAHQCCVATGTLAPTLPNLSDDDNGSNLIASRLYLPGEELDTGDDGGAPDLFSRGYSRLVPSSFDVVSTESAFQTEDLVQQDYNLFNASIYNTMEADFQDLFDFSAASIQSPQQVDGASALNTTTTFAGGAHNAATISNISATQPANAVVSRVSNNNQRPYNCPHPQCTLAFRRRGDRDHHALSHNPNAPRFSCTYPGCSRVGRRGFLRRDKLAQHQAHMNH